MKASATNRLLSLLPLLGVCFIVGCAVFAPDVYAGDGGQEFEDVWTTLKDWTQGTLGRIIGHRHCFGRCYYWRCQTVTYRFANLYRRCNGTLSGPDDY